MHVRQCYEVKVAHVVLPEKRGHQLHASVKAPVIRAAPIDEECMIPRHLFCLMYQRVTFASHSYREQPIQQSVSS